MTTHRLLLLLLGLAVFTGGHAQLSRYSLDIQMSASDFVDTIQVEWQQQQIYVPVEIGDTTYRFLLDTGSGQTVVYSDSPFLDLCDGAGQMIAHDAIGVSDTVQVVSMPPMTIGSVTFTSCQATVHRRAVSGRAFDGILGFDLVCRGLSLKIDVAGRRIIWSDRKDFFDDEPGFDARYRLNFHVPFVSVSPFGKFTEEVLFDTGSRKFYAINKQSFDQGEKTLTMPLGRQVEGRTMGRHAIGNYGAEPRGEVVFLALQRLKLSDFTFTDVHAVTTQGGSHLGAPLLEKGTVAFNPRRRRLRFMPYEGGQECRVGNAQLEIAFVAQQGMPAVGLVWEGGEPYRQGFREGDVVTAIDGRPVRSITQFNAWGFERGRAYRFTLRSPRGFTHEALWVRIPE